MGLRAPSYDDVVYRGYRAILPSATRSLGSRWRRGRVSDHELHVDADAVCPRCMRWIEPGDFVRRTAYGPHQHEAC